MYVLLLLWCAFSFSGWARTPPLSDSFSSHDLQSLHVASLSFCIQPRDFTNLPLRGTDYFRLH